MAIEPLVVTICDRKGGYQDELERRLAEESLDYLCVFIEPFSWRLRALKTLEIAREYPDRPLVFVDAWDTLLLGSKKELVAWFECHEGVMLAASKKCWPDVERYLDYNVKQAGQPMSAWRYVNSNPMAGLGRNIAAAMEWTWERDPVVGDSADTREPDGNVCERFYTTMYLESPFAVEVDSRCVLNQIFLCSTPGDLFVAERRIHNLKTGSRPIWLHLNGRIQFPLELLR